MGESGPEGSGLGRRWNVVDRSERGEGARKDSRWSVISGWDLENGPFGAELPSTHVTYEQAIIEFTRTHPLGQGGDIKYALVSIRADQAFEFGRDGEAELLSFQPLTDTGMRWEFGRDTGPRTVTITTDERA